MFIFQFVIDLLFNFVDWFFRFLLNLFKVSTDVKEQNAQNHIEKSVGEAPAALNRKIVGHRGHKLRNG